MIVDFTKAQLDRLIEAMEKDAKDASDRMLLSYLGYMKQKASVQEKEFIQRSIDLDEIPF